MKRGRMFLMVAFLVLSAVVVTAATNDKVVTLKIGYGISSETVAGKYVGLWAKQVTEATGGRVKFEIYPSGQLGSLVEMIEACDLHTLDITFNDPSLMVNYLPQIALLSQPMLIKDYKHLDAVVQGEVGKQLALKLESVSNLHILGWVRNGFRNIISKKPLTSLKDCKGLIIRSPESSVYIDTFTLLGMTPTPIPYNETYTALQTNVVQACDTSYENFILASFYEEAKYILETNHMAATMSLVINKDVWKSLPVDTQNVMMKIYNELFMKCNEEVAAAEQKYKQKLISLGCTISNFNDKDQDAIVKSFMDYWKKFAKKTSCADLLDKVVALR